MSAIGRFDPDLQMFVEPPRLLSTAHLGFLRWLGEHNRLEHRIEGAAPEPPADRRPWSAFSDEEPAE